MRVRGFAAALGAAALGTALIATPVFATEPARTLKPAAAGSTPVLTIPVSGK